MTAPHPTQRHWRTSIGVTELGRSPAWDDAVAQASVVIASCNRCAWLPGLLEALEAQDLSIEVVIVDDSSSDDTPDYLAAASTSLPLLALRTARRAGPSAARNTGAAFARTETLLLTDDDCLPQPGWATALLAGLDGRSVVQGQTLPCDDDHAPWDRSIEVRQFSGLFETCNLAVDAAVFGTLGGFTELRLLKGPAARGFGEDAELGSQLAKRGGSGWVPDAVVRHRWVPGDWSAHLAGRRRLAAFPALVGMVPEVEQRLVMGTVLSPRTLTTDVALVGLGAAALGPTWAALAALPWLRQLVVEAGHRPGRSRGVRAAQLALADVVGAAALLRGSLAARRPVL